MDKETLERQIAKAASDYRAGLSDERFANEYGGIDQAQKELFERLDIWELTE